MMTRLALAALTRLEQGTVRLCRALARPLRARVVRQMTMEYEGSTEKSALRALSTASTTDVIQLTTREARNDAQ